MPPNYKGAYELHLEKTKGSKAKFVDALADADEVRNFVNAHVAEQDAAMAAAAAPKDEPPAQEHAETPGILAFTNAHGARMHPSFTHDNI